MGGSDCAKKDGETGGGNGLATRGMGNERHHIVDHSHPQIL